MKWSCVLLGLLVSVSVWAGGGKAAYRHYVLGSFYFSEGDYSRSLGHLRQAQQLAPDEYSFNLALALALGSTGSSDDALSLLNRSDNLLKSYQEDYAAWRALRHYVTGLVYCFGYQYFAAIPAFKSAIQLQETLDHPIRLANMYNALGYADMMDQGRGKASSHSDMQAHYHVHPRDLERGLKWFERALEIDPTNFGALGNYQQLCIMLERRMEYTGRGDTLAKERPRYVSAKYSRLPAQMEEILAFGKYDEVVYLLDISGSMVQEEVSCVKSDRFRVMKETAQYLLDDIPETTAVGIGTIGGDCGTKPKLWHPAGELSRKDLRYALQFLAPDGTTPMLTILQETPTLFSNNDTTSKALFFISDGENICNVPGVDICEWTDELSSRGIQLNIMTFLDAGLNNTGAFAEYTCLADRTNGSILYLDGNRCSLERYQFDLVDNFKLQVPPMEPVTCWGPSVKQLWAVYPIR